MKRTNCKTPHVNIFIYVLVIETSLLLTLVCFSYNSDEKNQCIFDWSHCTFKFIKIQHTLATRGGLPMTQSNSISLSDILMNRISVWIDHNEVKSNGPWGKILIRSICRWLIVTKLLDKTILRKIFNGLERMAMFLSNC